MIAVTLSYCSEPALDAVDPSQPFTRKPGNGGLAGITRGEVAIPGTSAPDVGPGGVRIPA
jgi:hypothetical protein